MRSTKDTANNAVPTRKTVSFEISFEDAKNSIDLASITDGVRAAVYSLLSATAPHNGETFTVKAKDGESLKTKLKAKSLNLDTLRGYRDIINNVIDELEKSSKDDDSEELRKCSNPCESKDPIGYYDTDSISETTKDEKLKKVTIEINFDSDKFSKSKVLGTIHNLFTESQSEKLEEYVNSNLFLADGENDIAVIVDYDKLHAQTVLNLMKYIHRESKAYINTIYGMYGMPGDDELNSDMPMVEYKSIYDTDNAVKLATDIYSNIKPEKYEASSETIDFIDKYIDELIAMRENHHKICLEESRGFSDSIRIINLNKDIYALVNLKKSITNNDEYDINELDALINRVSKSLKRAKRLESNLECKLKSLERIRNEMFGYNKSFLDSLKVQPDETQCDKCDADGNTVKSDSKNATEESREVFNMVVNYINDMYDKRKDFKVNLEIDYHPSLNKNNKADSNS